jgi:hypothetical protein
MVKEGKEAKAVKVATAGLVAAAREAQVAMDRAGEGKAEPVVRVQSRTGLQENLGRRQILHPE